MTPVGPEGECGVAQAAEVAHALPIGRPAKPRILEDCLLQLGVGDLAVRRGPRKSKSAKERKCQEEICSFHVVDLPVRPPMWRSRRCKSTRLARPTDRDSGPKYGKALRRF